MIYLIHDPLRTDRDYRKELSGQGMPEDYVWIKPAVKETSRPIANISRAHKNCVREAMEKGFPSATIMEDDIMFLCNDSWKRFLELHGMLPPDRDIFFAGAYDAEIIQRIGSIAMVRKVSGLQCYTVYAHYYERFLSAPENINLDKWLTTPSMGNAVSYLAYPMLAIQHDGWSDNVKRQTNYNVQLREKYELWDCGRGK